MRNIISQAFGTPGFTGFDKRSFDSFTGPGFTGLDKRSAFDSFVGSGFTGMDKRAFDSFAGNGFTGFDNPVKPALLSSPWIYRTGQESSF
uniref:Uncharacterized protein n=1 Tax=Meloidogyne incognita TaxID=6306 RepID=A0A914NMX8_MELIC